MSEFRQDDPPSGATIEDTWADTFDEGKIYVCNETYDVSLDYATLTIPAANLAGTTDLVFTAVNAGNDGRYISIVITRAGASGTSSKTITGSGTQADPYIYTFGLYDDDSSNNAIIALISADVNVQATGTEATVATVTGVSQLFLDNSVMDYWTPYVVNITYEARLPEATHITQTISSHIPFIIKRKLAEAIAGELAIAGDAEDKANKALFDFEFNVAVEKANWEKSNEGLSNDIAPG